ncbi:regulatory protein [Friedmanniella endophytica]|uniref:Regulatory protein RecX n=1 Tax=Microlunatus kandeliicorticis TaxID=1759536 RepID=A0A7W3IUE0_9ACTN|nr:regulatory protein RecX [Microlunatus kandeliicorticis]MBA8795424.1 regulatory protein [Microlunatus kandeliicorticis]
MLTKLTAQARSRHELAEALRKRNVPDEVGDRVLDRMTEVGLVDDAAFAESWVTSRQSRRHLSKTALRQELVRKGVDREQIDGALEQVEPEDEYDAALALARKKARTTAGLDPVVRRRRVAGALARRGFGSDVTRRALAEALDPNADDSLDTP